LVDVYYSLNWVGNGATAMMLEEETVGEGSIVDKSMYQRNVNFSSSSLISYLPIYALGWRWKAHDSKHILRHLGVLYDMLGSRETGSVEPFSPFCVTHLPQLK
jgi:hypothetical protein